MMSLREYRAKSASLADFLPWVALVGPGVVLNKDGSFQRTARFRGPDLDSATPAELVAVTSRLNNALRRLGSGWAVFVEAQRVPAQAYPHSNFPDPVSALVDMERREQFREEGAHFESGYYLTLLWMPPPEDAARAESWLYEGKAATGVDPNELVKSFVDRTDRVLHLVEGFMPDAGWLDDRATLTYLHSTVSTKIQHVRVPETPVYLDALLTDEPLTGGLEPKLGQPLIDATADLVGPVGLFTNFVQILILLIAWVIVVIAFFVLAIQVFVTIIEFKLVTLAGFVLLPFAFFGRTAFMAERVLGHIISSGIKVLVLAVITGIGTTLFAQFINAGLGAEPDIQQVMAIALAALTLLGLGIFGPSIANGIVAGGPQLGAGAAAGTVIAAGATLAGGIAGAKLAAGAAGSAMAGAATGGARAAGGASRAYAAGAAGKTGGAAAASGFANVAKSAADAATSPLKRAANSLKANYASAKADAPKDGTATPDGPPAWATAMRRRQTMGQGASIATHTLKGGDSHGSGSGPDITDKS